MILFVQRAHSPTKVEEAWKFNSKENNKFTEVKSLKNLNELFFSITFILKNGNDLWMRRNLKKKKNPWKERFLFHGINYFDLGLLILYLKWFWNPKLCLSVSDFELLWCHCFCWEGGQWLEVGRWCVQSCHLSWSSSCDLGTSCLSISLLRSWLGGPYIRTSEKVNGDCVFTVVLVPTQYFGSLLLSEQLNPSSVGIQSSGPGHWSLHLSDVQYLIHSRKIVSTYKQ